MKNQIFRGARVQFTLLVLLMTCARVKCRQWQTIVDHDIVRKSNIDSSRYELKIEADPFFYPGDKSPTDIPTEAPKVEANKVWTTIGPAKSPSMAPTKSLPMKDTDYNIAQNGGCGNGLKHYEIHMMDTWGDGWDQTVITITGMSDQNSLAGDLPTTSNEKTHTNTLGDAIVSISKTIDFDSADSSVSHPNPANEIDALGQIFQGSLQQGYNDFADICLLPNRCYQLIATGGEFLEEVSWELRPGSNDPENPSVAMEPVLTGGASTGCTFSIPDENGLQFCPNTCSDEILANGMIDPPKATENLKSNEDGVSAEFFTEAVGRANTVPVAGTRDGGARSNTFVTKSLPLRSEGNGESASALWNNLQTGN